MEWAAAAGIPILHTGDGAKPIGMSDDEARRIFADKLAPILEAARKHRVTVAIEPHGSFSLTSEGLLWMMSLAEPGVLGINYDGCNIYRSAYVESGNNRSGWAGNTAACEDEVDVLRRVCDRVVHCHVKDINADKQCVALGEGMVNVGGCIEYLRSVGYDGVVSVETEGSANFDDAAAIAKKSYHYLKGILGE